MERRTHQADSWRSVKEEEDTCVADLLAELMRLSEALVNRVMDRSS